MPATRPDQRGEQCRAPVRGLEHHVRHDVVELQIGDLAAHLPAQGLVDFKLPRWADGHDDLGEQMPGDLSFLEAREPAQLRAVEPHRQDRGPGPVGNVGRAGIDLHQSTGDTQPPFRKDHAGLASIDLADQRLDRQRVGRVERVDVGDAPERLQPPAIGHGGVDREHRQLAERGHQQRAVQERDVVHDHQHLGAGLDDRSVLQAADLVAVSQPQDEVDDRLQGAAREHQAASLTASGRLTPVTKRRSVADIAPHLRRRTRRGQHRRSRTPEERRATGSVSAPRQRWSRSGWRCGNGGSLLSRLPTVLGDRSARPTHGPAGADKQG